jgi:hypothetical protein
METSLTAAADDRLKHYEQKHAIRLHNSDDRAYFDLLHDVRETPAIEDLNGDAGVSISRASEDDAGDRFAFETTASPYEGE